MKKVLAFLTLAMLTVFSTAALAQKQNDNAAPAAYDRVWQEHRQSMAAIQDKMWAKNMEYEALVANPNSKQADIVAVINEMTELRGQMRSERDSFSAQMGDKGYGPGMGFGPGPGRGYGHGMGYGPGCGAYYGGGRGYDGQGRGFGHGGGGRHHRNW